MKEHTKLLLLEAMAICNEDDKSTEYMIQFMMDYANVDHDCVITFLANLENNNG